MFKYLLICLGLLAPAVITPAAAGGKPMINHFNLNVLGQGTQDRDGFFPGLPSDYSRFNTQVAHIATTQRANIITLQEVDKKALVIVTAKFGTDYHIHYQEKGANGGVVTLARKDDFVVKGYSAIPLFTAGKSLGAAVITIFEDKRTRGTFAVVNTHISRTSAAGGSADGQAQEDQIIKGLHALASQLSLDPAKLPTIITGDFNTVSQEIKSRTLPALSTRLGQEFKDLYGHFAATVSDHTGIHRMSIDHVISAGLDKVDSWSSTDDIDPSKPIHTQTVTFSDHRAFKTAFVSPGPLGSSAAVSPHGAAAAVGGGSAVARQWPAWMDQDRRFRTLQETNRLALDDRENVLERARLDQAWATLNDDLVEIARWGHLGSAAFAAGGGHSSAHHGAAAAVGGSAHISRHTLRNAEAVLELIAECNKRRGVGSAKR